MANYPVTGLASSFRVPGTFGEVQVAQGPSTAASSVWGAGFVMPMTAAGTWAANTRYRVKHELEVRNGAGVGSPMHRGIKTYLRSNKNSQIYATPYAETTAGTPAKATGTVTWVTDPTGTGVTKVIVCGQVFTVQFRDTDTVTTIATAMKESINAAEDLPCVASNASGVLTLTARINGTSQGDGTTGVIRFHAEIDSGLGTTVAVSGAALGLGTGTAGAEGSTTEEAQLTAALSALTGVRDYYLVFSDWDAEAISAIDAHVSTKSEAKTGLRSVAITAFTGALAAGQTLATGANYERHRLVQQINSEWDPAQLAANMAAIYQKYEDVDCAYNFDSYSASDWLVPKAYSEADWPDPDDQNDAINDGITLIASNDSGSYVVMSCSTRSKNAAGTVDDFRATETHRVAVGDKLMDTLIQRGANEFQGKKLKDDKKKPDGTIDYNAKYPPKTITPYRARGLFKAVAQLFEERGQIDSKDYVMETLQTGIDPDNNGRLESTFNFNAINLAHQFTVRAAETSAG